MNDDMYTKRNGRDDRSFLSDDASTFYDLASGPPDPRAATRRQAECEHWAD